MMERDERGRVRLRMGCNAAFITIDIETIS